MYLQRLIAATLPLFIAACSLAGDAAPTTSAPAKSAESGGSADELSSGDSKVDAILDRLEEKGAAIKGLRCKLDYQYVIVDPVESRQIKEGDLFFARGEPNSKFLVHFTKKIADGIVQESGEYFAFDGRWLVERNDRAKKIIKREIAREGEKTDPFRIGKGPFPLPFGQKRTDILRNFKTTLEPFTLGDPIQSQHLKCVPIPNTELASRYARVDIFVDKRTELPVRIVTERLKDGNRIEVDFREVDTSDAPAGSRFSIEEPKDFSIEIERLEPGSKAAGPAGLEMP